MTQPASSHTVPQDMQDMVQDPGFSIKCAGCGCKMEDRANGGQGPIPHPNNASVKVSKERILRGSGTGYRVPDSDFNPSLARSAQVGFSLATFLYQGFQSQLGSIGATLRPSRSTRLQSISIPSWFDWRRQQSKHNWMIFIDFNPSLVRLARP